MKKFFSLAAFIIMLLVIANGANAKIRRVGFFGTPVTNTDYTTLQSAHDVATAGDTLLIFPGSWNATFSKKLIVIGYGYFVDTSTLHTQANPGLQNIKGTQSVQITFSAGSDNSIIEGLDGVNISGDNTGSTMNNITIRRCNCNSVQLSSNNVFTNWQFLQCYFSSTLYLNYYASGAVINSLTVNECYIYQVYGSSGTSGNNSGQFTNNTIQYFSPNHGSYIVKNNIITYSFSQDENCVYQNNLYNTDYGTLAGSGNVGVNSTIMSSNVFVGFTTQSTYSNDGRFALATGSPAKGIGTGGTDAGMYGGTNPYKLSGIPPVPAFYKLTAPSNTTSGNPYTITFSVRGNN